MHSYEAVYKIAFFQCIVICFVMTSHFSHAADPLDFSVLVSAPPNTPEAVTDVALNNICPGLVANQESQSSNLIKVCEFISGATPGTPEQIAEVVSELSPKSNTANGSFASKTSSISLNQNIIQRLVALRKSSSVIQRESLVSGRTNKGDPVNPFRYYLFDEKAERTSGLFDQRLSGFVNFATISSQHVETSTEIGYESSTFGVITGADYRIRSNGFLGIALQYYATSADLTDQGSELKSRQWGIGLYASHYLRQNWFMDSVLSIGKQSLDLSRHVKFELDGETIDDFAKGDTNSQKVDLYLATGYEYRIAPQINSVLMAAIVTSSNKIDGYSEDGAEGPI